MLPAPLTASPTTTSAYSHQTLSNNFDHAPSHSQSLSHDNVPVQPGATLQASQTSPPAAVAGASKAAQVATPTSQSNHRGNNLYACRDCGRSYSRPEHLVRHVQTHTLGRRFVCDICQKSFARKDLLRRHVANHDNDSPKKRRRTTTSPGAGRVSHACRSCAVARVKCDDTKPCKRCVSRNLNCVSTETPSTAAMHLMHLSANAHSGAPSPNNSGNLNNDGDKSVAATHSSHSATSTRDSNSPAPFTTSSHQPRSVTLPAPHSIVLDAAQDRSNVNLPHSLAKLPFQEPRSSEFLLPPIELEPSASAMDPNRLPYADFLRDILLDGSADSGRGSHIQGLTVLDFCDHENLELTVEDLANLEDALHSRQALARAWGNPPRTWESGSQDSTYGREESFERTVPETLVQSGRDRVLAILLNASRQNPSLNRIVGSFPSLEVMDFLVQQFLASMARQPYDWIHFPTLRPASQLPEWIAIAAAAGAVSSPILCLRKFGFVLQEAVRTSITTQLEENNLAIQDMALLQSLIMVQDVGLWSGNRRKMDIAECYLATPVQMMRHRRKFQGSHYPSMLADAADEGAVLEDKWRRWVDREKWKRLVFHCFVRDAQCSMATLTNPTISYAELTLPLPESGELWAATTALEWKTACLQSYTDRNVKAPTVGDVIQDCQLLRSAYRQLDVPFSLSIFMHAFWALILEHRQLSAIHRSRSNLGGSSMSGNQNLLLSSRHQELVKDLQTFQMVSAEWLEMTCQDHMVLNLLLMNLHASLDDIQLFTGKDGEEEARRIYPVLQQWSTTSEARSSIWYAGQVIRYARLFAPGQLKDFYAVAVQHAAVVLWAYGVMTRAGRRQRSLSPHHSQELLSLDDGDSVAIQNFIGIGSGRPVIRNLQGSVVVSESLVDEPWGCMSIVQEVLRSNFKYNEAIPTVVENLCHLLKQVGDASWVGGQSI
ncbi:unnamed protein product [Clonostachys rhizophaga]|uniref:pH-response transcription factor pacC/RIM101 n=1 Tax=Clonostachys rhizophaga TaxID=160324 RepID=A0A9N9VI70_9HYPO|nr:unnamed protein product [Clonostachys rhizophaga]